MRTFYIFFFSSRRRHTRWPRDWSSDVCSSDLVHLVEYVSYEPFLVDVPVYTVQVGFFGILCIYYGEQSVNLIDKVDRKVADWKHGTHVNNHKIKHAFQGRKNRAEEHTYELHSRRH